MRYEVTGTAESVSIAYSTWQDGDQSTSQVTARSLPWTKEVTAKGVMKGATLGVTLGESGGEVACSVIVDDQPPRRATASGAFATATCSGS
ncbi:MmpS family transport accessory protein [Streptomyces sp. NPDC088755]|uniref:MmpS family transport accessory protein n=1 Tax=Streptomyces sp. NPDC088755 TaxID=3365888 RepID=UPI00380FDF5C